MRPERSESEALVCLRPREAERADVLAGRTCERGQLLSQDGVGAKRDGAVRLARRTEEWRLNEVVVIIGFVHVDLLVVDVFIRARRRSGF